MRKTFAIVAAGIVSNMVEIDDTDTHSIETFCAIAIPPGQAVNIGSLYDGINFSTAAVVQPPPTLSQQRQVVIAQIVAIEATQSRALREAVLGQPGAIPRLQAIDSSIVTLRLQLALLV